MIVDKSFDDGASDAREGDGEDMVMEIASASLVVIFLGAVGDGEGLYGNGE